MPTDPVPPAAPDAKTASTATPARRPLLSRKAWRLIAAAVAFGVLLFVVVWLRQRGRDDFFRVDPSAPGSTLAVDALPAPMADADGSNATDQVRPGDASAPLPPPIAAPAPIPLPAPTPSPTPTDAVAGNAFPPAGPAMPGSDGPPQPISSPPPRYPPAALRNGDSGTVVLRVQVGADGVPTRVEVAETSRVRLLDRAAVEAVGRWRFRPAQRNGQAVAGEVRLPISFNAAR